MTDQNGKITLGEYLAGQAAPGLNIALLRQTLNRIEAKKRRLLYLSSFMRLMGLFLPIVAAILTWSSIVTEISQTPIWALVSLFFSNPQVIIANWQDYVWYIVEVLPIFSLTLFLALVWSFLLLLKSAGQIININNFKIKI
ncbi:MAG: hypothetical protein WCG01_04915 [bacterium]